MVAVPPAQAETKSVVHIADGYRQPNAFHTGTPFGAIDSRSTCVERDKH